jgi:hypothetical protein
MIAFRAHADGPGKIGVRREALPLAQLRDHFAAGENGALEARGSKTAIYLLPTALAVRSTTESILDIEVIGANGNQVAPCIVRTDQPPNRAQR